jgi:hypothetical protein
MTKVVGAILHLFQGHASSHVSVASQATKATSVVATIGYFGAIYRSVAEINACRWVICPKNIMYFYCRDPTLGVSKCPQSTMTKQELIWSHSSSPKLEAYVWAVAATMADLVP